jgi:hypothetical protein
MEITFVGWLVSGTKISLNFDKIRCKSLLSESCLANLGLAKFDVEAVTLLMIYGSSTVISTFVNRFG